MNYRSEFDYQYSENLILNIDKLEKLEEALSIEDASNNTHGFSNVKFEYKKNPITFKIILREYFGIFDDALKFAQSLSQSIVKGRILLSFIGEDCFTWGYMLKPNNVEKMVPILIAQKMYDAIKDGMGKEILGFDILERQAV